MLKLFLLFVFIGINSGIPIHFPSISKPIINNQKRIEIPNDDCGICNYIVAHSEERISNSTIEKSAINIMKNICETLQRKRQTQCMAMIQQNSKRLIRMISKKEDSSIICSDMHICSIPQNNVTDCTFCKYASVRIDGFLSKNHTLFDLINFAENFCEDISENYYETCSRLMDIYYLEIIAKLMDRNNPIDACEAIKLCEGGK
jgi:hypothetical protein